MERLTKRYRLFGRLDRAYVSNDDCCQNHMSAAMYEGPAIERLAEYEDTGLMPEEVAELAQAEKDGRLVVLPCKVGDTMYSAECGKTRAFVVDSFEIDRSALCTIEQIKLSRAIRVYGLNAFLTQEEAEAALKGGAK